MKAVQARPTVLGCSLGLNIVAGNQHIALMLPARVFRAEFAKRGLAPTNLSRLTADGGTVTSPLVSWNSCGAFMAAALGVPTLLYLPFAFFCIFSPLLSLLYGITGFKIESIEPHIIESDVAQPTPTPSPQAGQAAQPEEPARRAAQRPRLARASSSFSGRSSTTMPSSSA